MNQNSSLPRNQKQMIDILSGNDSYIEPNIRKAKFILSTSRSYQLEFDHNIEMQKLKMMIQKAAHLKKNSFALVCNGESYTQYNEETFDSLFPNEKLVIFTLEILNPEEASSETELLLQINTPCPDHNYKFLLYYCFDCGKSICSDCFTSGLHKGHKIQDKCFYLLSSKYLVEKMFENWAKNPFEEFQISADLNDYKNNLNNKIFKQLFLMLQEIQNKCNALIDKYNQINEQSLNNIRESVRDIKVSCIKALDEYKNAINVKDIINNEEIFVDFDRIYKEMGIQHKEKFKENVIKFQELNKSISILVQNLIDNICKNINDNLLLNLNNKQFENIENKINLKLIKPVDKVQIMNQISDKKNKIKNKKYKRKTLPIYDINLSKGYNDIKNNIKEKGRNTMNLDNSLFHNSSMDKSEENMLDLTNNSYDNIDMMNNINKKFHFDNSGFSADGNAKDLNKDNINKNYYNTEVYLKKQGGRKININIDDANLKKDNQMLNNIMSQINKSSKISIKSNKEEKEVPQSKKNNELFQNSSKQAVEINTNDNSNPFMTFGAREVNDTNNTIFIPQNNNEILINKNIYLEQNGTNNIKDIKNVNHIPNVFQSILNSKTNNNNNQNTNLNVDMNDIFNNKLIDSASNQNVNNSINDISPIVENRAINININQSNNSSFNHDINNLNNASSLNRKENNEIQNPFFIPQNIDSNSSKNFKNKDTNINIFKDNNNNIQESKKIVSPFTNIRVPQAGNNFINQNYDSNSNKIEFNDININNTPQNDLYQNPDTMNTNIKTAININERTFNKSDNNNGNDISQTSQSQIFNNNGDLVTVLAKKINDTKNAMDKKYLNLIGKNSNFNPIYEESGESESELKHQNTKKTINIEYYLNKAFILCPIIGTNKLKIITEDEDVENTIMIKFPKDIGFSTFLKDLSYCNYDKKLYISGGILDEDTQLVSNKFFVIDFFQKTPEGNNSIITELHPMNYSRKNHSMIGYNDKIYIVGGDNNDKVERYDIESDKFELLNPMINERAKSNLFVYEGYLYAFFGKENDAYLKSIERLDIRGDDINEWEMILFQNINGVDIRVTGCGLYQVDELLYFIGGNRMGQNSDEIFFLNMKERIIDRTDVKLNWKVSFRENTLFQLGTRLGQITEDEYYGIYLKIIVE